jgi:threonine/homoserine/homoserine lactone efflux protein
VEIQLLAAFWVVSFSLAMTPGADWAYTISAGLRDHGLAPAVAGILLGHLMFMLVVAAGVGALVASVPTILTALTFIGVAYLLWLGIGILRKPPVPTIGEEQTSGSWYAWTVRGFAISGLNPKVLLLFLALLPQFTRPDAEWPIFAQIIAMGCVHIVNCALVYSLVGIGAKVVLRTRPKVARMVSQFSGAAMIAIAFLLLAEQMLVLRGA